MKRAVFFLVITTAISLAGNVMAQGKYTYGIDARRDSMAFGQFRLHLDSIRKSRPTVALVLSGGGAKGAAHIPILQYLDSIGMPIDLVLGTSIGGLLGGLYAVGYTGDDLEKLMRTQDWDYIMRDTHPRRFDDLRQKDYDNQFQFNGAFGRRILDIKDIDKRHENVKRGLLADGMVHGRNVEDLFASLLVGFSDTCDFLKLPIPFMCVATDMVTAKPKVWHSGSLITALRSTMSIPGLFTPVKQNGMVLLDGGMRSNMPAEIAEQLGADIIITIDISSPSLNASQINSLVDIVFQATDVMAREAYVAGLAATNIYIQPDVSGYTMLSFDTASITQLIGRGKAAVAKCANQLDSLAMMIGRTSRQKHKAVDISKQPILIDTIVFEGLTNKETRNIRKMLNIGDVAVKHYLDDAVATMIGTRTLEKATYQLLGDTMPYKLVFHCRRSPLNEVGASARFDAVEYASLILHLGLGAHRLTGSRYDLTMRLGQNTLAELGYTYRTGHAVDFGFTASFQALREGGVRLSGHTFSIDFNRTRLDASMTLMPLRQMKMQTGIRLDGFYRISMLADLWQSSGSYETMPESNIWPVLYAKMRSDTYDDAYFPTSGTQFMAFYSWTPGGVQHDGPGLHTWHSSFRAALSNPELVFLPFIEARYVSTTVIPYINMLSVSDANKCLDQQITMMGINTAHTAMRTVATAGLNIRREIRPRHHFMAGFQLLRQSNNLNDLFDKEWSAKNVGLSFEYSYNSLIGPLRFNIHWSDLVHKLGFYLGFGLNF